MTRAPAAGGPAPGSPSAPVPTFHVPRPAEDHQSIFGERHDEDVFGSEPPRPTMVMPPAPPASSHPAEMLVPPADPEPTADPLAFDARSTADCRPEGPTALQPPPRTPDPERRVLVREAAPPTQAFAWIMLAYAAVATALAGFFGFQYFTTRARGDHPFKAIPDFYGQFDPAQRKQLSFHGLPDAKLDVPADHRVKIGQNLTVGDLQVTPTSVQKQKLLAVTVPAVGDPNGPRGTGKETLVLTLRVKNVSTDTVFHPNDPAFHRAAQKDQPTPYTALEIGRRFFHGTFRWPPDPGTVKEFVAGHESDELPLQPGEERDTWVAVAPWGVRAATYDVIDAVSVLKPEDRLLWRVQLRRGLMKVPGDGGQEVEVSATTVIGVDFGRDEIK